MRGDFQLTLRLAPVRLENRRLTLFPAAVAPWAWVATYLLRHAALKAAVVRRLGHGPDPGRPVRA